MTEAEWLASSDPRTLLEYIRGKTTDRKLRLFAAASFGRLTGILSDPRQRQGIEVLEQLAEGAITPAERRRVTTLLRQAIPIDESVLFPPPTPDRHLVGMMLYREFCSGSAAIHAVQATAGLVEEHEQTRLFRDLVGNPFRPFAFDPRWRTADVLDLARGIYEDRAFDRLLLLADALMDAGCADKQVLAHCRSDGPHVRGCWVVDLVLGKE